MWNRVRACVVSVTLNDFRNNW